MNARNPAAAERGIAFVDLRAQYHQLQEELQTALAEVFAHGDFVRGEAVQAFEAAFATRCQTPHCVGVSNGSDALFLTLHALGIGPGDEVLTVPNTFIATASAIARTGATPRFVDVDPATLLMDTRKIESALTVHTKAVLPVHLYGLPVDMTALLQLARIHGLLIVEDAAQAHGASDHRRPTGSMGVAGCFSFFPAKNLGAFGDAGAVVTHDQALAQRLRRLRDHGRETKYEHLELGFNHRLDTLQAAVLNVKLRHLQLWTMRRRELAACYRRLLQDCPQVWLPAEPPGRESACHLFVVQVEQRDRVRARLQERGIPTGVHYPLSLHLQPALRHFGLRPGAFPVAEAAAGRVLSLPLHPEMTEAMVEEIAQALIASVGK